MFSGLKARREGPGTTGAAEDLAQTQMKRILVDEDSRGRVCPSTSSQDLITKDRQVRKLSVKEKINVKRFLEELMRKDARGFQTRDRTLLEEL
jgi:hypothetical protein